MANLLCAQPVGPPARGFLLTGVRANPRLLLGERRWRQAG
jgi:hypothetical protein